MKTQELMDLIDQTAQDEAVKNDPELFEELTLAYKGLDEGKDVKIVVQRLSSSLSHYLMKHEYKAPQALITLMKAMQNDANSFWKGTGISQLFW